VLLCLARLSKINWQSDVCAHKSAAYYFAKSRLTLTTSPGKGISDVSAGNKTLSRVRQFVDRELRVDRAWSDVFDTYLRRVLVIGTPDSSEISVTGQFFFKFRITKFNENSFIAFIVIPCVWTDIVIFNRLFALT
jgi:hypothetical protein